jgi:hypothetical protein
MCSFNEETALTTCVVTRVDVQTQIHVECSQSTHQRVWQDFVPVSCRKHAAEQLGTSTFPCDSMKKRCVNPKSHHQRLKNVKQVLRFRNVEPMRPR